jgi:hypothetical protein
MLAQFIRVVSRIPFFGCIVIDDVIADTPKSSNAGVRVQIDTAGITMRVRSSETFETYPAQRIRCWKITEDKEKGLAFSFDYLLEDKSLTWVSLRTKYAIWISQVFQLAVDQIMRDRTTRPHAPAAASHAAPVAPSDSAGENASSGARQTRILKVVDMDGRRILQETTVTHAPADGESPHDTNAPIPIAAPSRKPVSAAAASATAAKSSSSDDANKKLSAKRVVSSESGAATHVRVCLRVNVAARFRTYAARHLQFTSDSRRSGLEAIKEVRWKCRCRIVAGLTCLCSVARRHSARKTITKPVKTRCSPTVSAMTTCKLRHPLCGKRA